MIWTAPSEKDLDSEALEKRLWAAADQLRANSGLTSQQYSQPVLELIFLRFAEVRFSARRSELVKAASSSRRGSRVDEPSAYHAEGVGSTTCWRYRRGKLSDRRDDNPDGGTDHPPACVK